MNTLDMLFLITGIAGVIFVAWSYTLFLHGNYEERRNRLCMRLI